MWGFPLTDQSRSRRQPSESGGIADPNESIAKAVELSCVLRDYIENINLQRMRELKYQ